MRGVVRQTGRYSQWLPVNSQWWAKLDLLKALVIRDLEARYKGAVLGNFWSLVNQLSQLLIYTYVFAIVLQVKLNLQGLPENKLTFGLWMFAGLLPWIAFISGLLPAAVSVVNQQNLVKKVVFPLALLPLVPVFSAFAESSIGLMSLIVLVAITTHTVHFTLCLLPLVWIPQLLLTGGLSYLVAGLTVFIRDVPQTLTVVTNLWFYLTPIVYPASLIPEKWQVWIFWLNPMTIITESYRDFVLQGSTKHLGELGVVFLVSLLVFYGGLSVYRRLRSGFADVL